VLAACNSPESHSSLATPAIDDDGGAGDANANDGCVAGPDGCVAGQGGGLAGQGGGLAGQGGGVAGQDGGVAGSDGGAPDAGTSDGMPSECTAGETRCNEGCLQTCTSDGDWGLKITCAGHRTCTGEVGDARCVCKEDKVCSAAGDVCASATTLVTCAPDEFSCFYQVSSTTCAEGTVCERTATPGCVDPNWAEWPMPNSPAEVANGAPNPQSYADHKDGTVTDKVTGLMWQQGFAEAKTLGDAQNYCQTNLSLAGFSDWRLPTIIELISIADFGRTMPAIDTTAFPADSGDDHFWSSSLRDGFPSNYYTVTFFRGLIFNDDGDGQTGFAHAVRCVR
jgi:hypothetical protein